MDFKNNRINRANITKAYNALFARSMSAKELLLKSREKQPYKRFTNVNMFHRGSAHFYKLP